MARFVKDAATMVKARLRAALAAAFPLPGGERAAGSGAEWELPPVVILGPEPRIGGSSERSAAG